VHNASEWLPESENADLATVMQRNMAIHVQAPYLINSGLESLLMAGAEKYGMADIIHLTDYVAARGSQKHIAYAASKAALHNLTLSFASKLAPHIKVNSIAPALLMFRDEDDAAYKEKVARKSLLPPGPGADEGIRAVTMLLDSHYMTGQTIALDGGRHLKAG
jgi:dihydromonapterin reductase/dihydrofolate reductase